MPSASVGPFEIILRDVVTPVGLEVSAVRIWGEGASFETEPFSYEPAGEAQVEALIHETMLEAFVQSKVPDNIQNLSLKLKEGKVLITATVRMILPIAANIVCTLRLEEGKRVFVDLVSAEAIGASVKGIVQKQLDAINPVLDVAHLPVEIVLEDLKIRDGAIVATGSLA